MISTEHTRLLTLVAAIFLLGPLAACSDTAPTAVVVDKPSALADHPVEIRVTGVDPGEQVTVTAEAADYADTQWRSTASFTADDHGVVALNATAPIRGSYQGVDPMGLFWSMNPPTGDAEMAWFRPLFPEVANGYDVLLTAIPAHSKPAHATVHRVWLTPGTRHRSLTAATDHMAGELYQPSTDGQGSVLLLGGSEGGAGLRYEAALLASHGYTALALGYFALPGLPATLRDIPIEYFAAAVRTLPEPVRVIGNSRGTEAALLVSALYPDLVRGTVLYATTDRVVGAFPPPGNAWTFAGNPQTAIPFSRITGPVLAIAGTDDRLWRSEPSSASVTHATGGQMLLFDGAGHGVGAAPYLPAGTKISHPVTREFLELGGTRADNARARAEGWPRVLGLFAQAD